MQVARRMSESVLKGFAPLAGNRSSVLILGSMPGNKSLTMSEYYGHPRNAFWPIMHELFGIPVDACYESRVSQLIQKGVALWDVIGVCHREGSLDANIERTSVVPNDFANFYARHRGIKTVVFNGGRAALEYKRHVLALSKLKYPEIVYHQLPSTSPAHAGMTYTEKYRRWSIVKSFMK